MACADSGGTNEGKGIQYIYLLRDMKLIRRKQNMKKHVPYIGLPNQYYPKLKLTETSMYRGSRTCTKRYQEFRTGTGFQQI